MSPRINYDMDSERYHRVVCIIYVYTPMIKNGQSITTIGGDHVIDGLQLWLLMVFALLWLLMVFPKFETWSIHYQQLVPGGEL